MANNTTNVQNVQRRDQINVPIHSVTLNQASGDTVQLFNVPAGFVITGLDFDWVGTSSATLSIGDTSVGSTHYVSALSTATTGASSLLAQAKQGSIGYKYTAADTIYATIGGASVDCAYSFVLRGFMDYGTQTTFSI